MAQARSINVAAEGEVSLFLLDKLKWNSLQCCRLQLHFDACEMNMRVMEDLVSIREAAKESGRNMETVRRWVWSGKLPAQKLGNQLFIRRSDLRAFLDRLSVNKRGAWDKLEAIERAEALQKRIRARTGTNFDISALIEESRQRHNL